MARQPTVIEGVPLATCRICKAEFVDDATHVCEKKEKKVEATTTALVPTNGETKLLDPKKAQQDLTRIEARIDALHHEVAKSAWDVGKELSEIRARDLWRTTEAKSFAQYVERRFGFTNSNARSMMAISNSMDRDEATDIPSTHLQLIAKAPSKAAREELLKMTKADRPTTRELKAQVKEARKEAGKATERRGLEGTFMISERVKAGMIAEGDWQTLRDVRVAKFEIGGVPFVFEDHKKDGFRLKVFKPKE